jgi:hypothetical protein
MAKNTIVTPEPVVLEGFQAVMKPGKFGGYNLKAIIDQKMVDQLEEERPELLKWAVSKLSNPKRGTLKPEPWEEVDDNKYVLKFAWREDNKPGIVDTEGTPIEDLETPIYSGSMVKLAFYQKPYILKDKTTYGTNLRLQGIQIVSLSSSAGVDVGDMNEEDVASLFGTTTGFKVSEPNVMPAAPSSVEDDTDF